MEQLDNLFHHQQKGLIHARYDTFDHIDNTIFNGLPSLVEGQPAQDELMLEQGQGEPAFPQFMPDWMMAEPIESDPSSPEEWPEPSILPSIPNVTLHGRVTRPSSFGDLYDAYTPHSFALPPHQSNFNGVQYHHSHCNSNPRLHSFEYTRQGPLLNYDDTSFGGFHQHQIFIKQEPDLDTGFGGSWFGCNQYSLPAVKQDPDLYYDNFSFANLTQTFHPTKQYSDLDFNRSISLSQHCPFSDPGSLALGNSDLDMHGRRSSEPYAIGSPGFFDDTIANIQTNSMYRQILDHHNRSKDEERQLLYVASGTLTQAHGAPVAAKIQSYPGDIAKRPFQSKRVFSPLPEDARRQANQGGYFDVTRPGNLNTQYPFHGSINGEYERYNMGQDASQIAAAESKFLSSI
jgi:hypothetical protein